jgi:mRNA turnover protein 4
MPRSRRQRVKALTKVAPKKSSELKQKIVESIREAADSYDSAYAFAFNNMRTNHFKDVRLEFRDSR